MTNYDGKPIGDVIEWPPSVWAGAVGRPNPLTATVREAVVRDGTVIRLMVDDGDRTYTTAIDVADDGFRERIVEVLSGASGRTLSEAGGLLLRP